MGDLRFVYPVARGSAPLSVALLSAPLIGERLSGPGLAGILVIPVGIADLAYHPRTVAQHIPDLLRAASVGLCIAVYTFLDGVGARISGNVLGYTAMMNIFSGLPLMAVAFYMRGGETANFLRREWKTGVVGGGTRMALDAIMGGGPVSRRFAPAEKDVGEVNVADGLSILTPLRIPANSG